MCALVRFCWQKEKALPLQRVSTRSRKTVNATDVLGKAWKTEPSSFRFAVFASLTTTFTAAAVAAEEINQKVNDLNHAKDHAPNEDEQSEEEGKQQEDLFKCHDNHLIFVG